MPFCAAAAIADGRVGIDTFDDDRISDPALRALMARVTTRVDPSLGTSAPPLTQARVRITLADGRMLSQDSNGARGYPANPASERELADKFRTCARRALSDEAAADALTTLLRFADTADVPTLTSLVQPQPAAR
jgi:2-methylcitrate dehydratase PrpD